MNKTEMARYILSFIIHVYTLFFLCSTAVNLFLYYIYLLVSLKDAGLGLFFHLSAGAPSSIHAKLT